MTPNPTSNEKSFSSSFYNSIRDELFNNILPYWEKYSRDTRPGCEGFYGSIDNSNTPDKDCPRSIVMTSRFLWTYSAVARYTKDARYLEMAEFAYEAIVQKYLDGQNGGVYWSVTPDGRPDVSKKQIYGEAFCIYGLSEYAAAVKELREGEVSPCAPTSSVATPSPKGKNSGAVYPLKNPGTYSQAMNLAVSIYNLLEQHALDPAYGGYLEACARDWSPTDDMILSPKDMNCPKSMNTNLHVMEAYTNLYRTLQVVSPDAETITAQVGKSLSILVNVTIEKIVQPNNHLGMFFDMEWKLLADEVSYGHDIEASWLLWEAVCELKDEKLKEGIRQKVLDMAETALQEGFDFESGCMENYSKDGGKVRNRNRVWWIQAETINGFYNAWEMTGLEKYSEACLKQWKWILEYQKDTVSGEWWNEVDSEGKPVLTEAKGGNWKTSYHNGRTCLEVLRRSKK